MTQKIVTVISVSVALIALWWAFSLRREVNEQPTVFRKELGLAEKMQKEVNALRTTVEGLSRLNEKCSDDMKRVDQQLNGLEHNVKSLITQSKTALHSASEQLREIREDVAKNAKLLKAKSQMQEAQP